MILMKVMMWKKYIEKGKDEIHVQERKLDNHEPSTVFVSEAN